MQIIRKLRERYRLLDISGMLILVLILLGVTTNCSMIGYSLGRQKDADTANGIANIWGIALMEDGASIRIELNNRDSLIGVYSGFGELQRKEYKEHYSLLKASYSELTFLPDIGDTIAIVDKFDKRIAMEFFSIYVVFDGESWNSIISGRPLVEGVSGNQKLESVKTLIDKQGNSIDINSLKLLIYDGKIPLSTAIKIRVGDDNRVIPIDEITAIEILSKRSWAISGFLSGLAADIVFAYSIYFLFKDFEMR